MRSRWLFSVIDVGAQRKKTHHGTHLEPGGAAIGQAQDVVVETVLLVPHAVLTGTVHRCGNEVEVLGELVDHGLVGAVMDCQLRTPDRACSG